MSLPTASASIALSPTDLLPVLTLGTAAAESRLAHILERGGSFDAEVEAQVRAILERVRTGGDRAVREYTARFDGAEIDALRVESDEIDAAFRSADPEFVAILRGAAANIRRHHERQRRSTWVEEDGDGVMLGMRFTPLDRVGLYVPGGKAVYPSSVLMNAIPALVAGVPELHLVSPPDRTGHIHPHILVAAHVAGVTNIYRVGGAQAVAALAFGTESIPKVDKIVGPGNLYVATAKRLVFGAVGIDSVAGPSEIAVLADDTADPRYIAADLFSQAEHDERASAILVTTSARLAEAVAAAMDELLPRLSRQTTIRASLRDFGALFVARSEAEAVDTINRLAPEHLEILTRDPWATMTTVRHAGAIFLGPASTEPVGDYFAGTNHVLPTGGTARFASPLGVDDFVKRTSLIQYSAARLRRDGPKIVRFAQAEQLDAHALAVQLRLDDDEARS